MIAVGLLTVSDRAARGEYEDQSGPFLAEELKRQTDWRLLLPAVVPDDAEAIRQALLAWCDQGADLILTTGGTGFAPRDVTPEATAAVIQRPAPGIAEALRAESLKITRHAMLSRAVAGIRGRTLIINLPGSPKAVREALGVLLPILPHALEQLLGKDEAGHRSI
ncbi:MAG: MogA/MoaB family molybdenum cofactor biosynthesis protein [Candidatus Promineifilaceae bacterium]